MEWQQWVPGLQNGNQTLGAIYDSLPGFPPQDIHFLVRLLENPESKFSLSGAIPLFEHDCIHVILGRGLLPQDEAFVIGFTMGCSSTLHRWEVKLYEFVSHHLYPDIYNFNDDHLKVFEFAVEMGRTYGPKNIHAFPFKNNLSSQLHLLRTAFSLDPGLLKEIYQEEHLMVPHSIESSRLIGL